MNKKVRRRKLKYFYKIASQIHSSWNKYINHNSHVKSNQVNEAKAEKQKR